jgi:hypothetical protein
MRDGERGSERKRRLEEEKKTMPDREDIQKIFDKVGNSAGEKVVLMSVIQSNDNFGEEDRDDEGKRDLEEESKDDQSDEFHKQSSTSSNKPVSAKAAVPILDFTSLPESKSKQLKSSENLDNNDSEMKSGSIGSIFDQDTHLDLSSKRLKKLILTSDFSSLINLREEALKYKETKERSKINKLLNTAKISPRTCEHKQYELEKWITNEKAEIKKTKKIIEEARRKTEDVLKEAQINSEFMKQIFAEKIMTPREGISVRSGMNSSRRQYELKHKDEDIENKTESVKSEKQLPFLGLNSKDNQIDQKNELDDRSDIDALVSVETPQIGSEGNSSFNNTKKIKFDPNILKDKPDSDSFEPNICQPISLKIHASDSSSNKNSSSSIHSEPEKLSNPQSLSRKKSEHHLKEIISHFPSNELRSKIPKEKSPIPSQPKSTNLNPFNSDNFFTQNFDDQEMEEAIMNLKNTSGKMTAEDEKDRQDEIDLLNQAKHNNKIGKTKDSRNANIKESKANSGLSSGNEISDEMKYFGVNDDVEFLRKKKKEKKEDREDSRNEKQVQQQEQPKNANSGDSAKEDILIEKVREVDENEGDDKAEDNKNITGEQSLSNSQVVTPSKDLGGKEHDFESDEKSNLNENSDSKYATVSILSELSKKSQNIEGEGKSEEEKEMANKLSDLIYSAMLAEIKEELFPQRPLFLLTADLDKIELEQALIYLNDMSVEKEAALLKEYLRYSIEDEGLGSWDIDKHDKDSDESKMFSDSGKLVLYERKGISTDLFSIENYVDELAEEVDAKCKPKFLTDTFTSIKKDSIAMLNQLQNSDIGTFEHFETDLNAIAILPLEVYLELERKNKEKENEENKDDELIGKKENSKASKNKQKEKKLLKE